MPETPKKKYRFRVLSGAHSEGGKLYKKGDIVESASDLLKHNDPQYPRFSSVDDVVYTQESKDQDLEGLEEMTFAELKSYAKEGDIDTTGATTKADLIEAIKKAEA